jgi:hypothetical protein
LGGKEKKKISERAILKHPKRVEATCLEHLQSTSKGFYFADAVVLINILQFTFTSAHHLKPFSFVRILVRKQSQIRCSFPLVGIALQGDSLNVEAV